jgi:uncharacterized damage-inducible protein DinB
MTRHPLFLVALIVAVALTTVPTQYAGAQTSSKAPKEGSAPNDSAPRYRTMTDVLREHEWGDEINNLLDVVAAMPDDKYAYRTKSARSFGEIVGHITDVQFGFCDAARNLKIDRGASWEKKPAKSDAIHGLRLSIAACDSAFDQLTDAKLTSTNGGTILGDLVVTVLGHTRRETGKLVAYLRFAGVVPPEIHYMRGRVWRHPNAAAPSPEARHPGQ